MAEQEVFAKGRDFRIDRSRNDLAIEAEAQEKALEASQMSFGDTFDLATEEMWLHKLYQQAETDQSFVHDLNWNPTEEEKKEVFNAFDESFHEFIFSATSPEEFTWRKQRAEKTRENQMQLAQQGFTGVAASMAAAVTDPALIPLYFVPFGAVGKAGQGVNTAARIWKYSKAGMIGGAAESALVSSLEYQLRPDAEALDLLYGTLMGAGLGGTVGAAAGAIARKLEVEAVRESGVPLSPKGEQYVSDVAPNAERVIDSIDVEAEALMALEPDDSVGAMRVINRDLSLRSDVEDSIDDFYETPTITRNIQDALKIRENLSAVVRAGRSENGEVRYWAMQLGQVSGDITGDGPIPVAATTRKQMMDERYTNSFYESQRMVDLDGYAEHEFNEIAGKAIRGDQTALAKLKNDSQREFVEEVRRLFAEQRAEAQRYGVRGFSDIPENPNYIPRQYDMQKVADFIKKHGQKKLDQVFATLIRRANEGLDDETIKKVARSYRKSIQGKMLNTGINLDKNVPPHLRDLDNLRKALIEEDVDEDVIEQVLDTVKVKGKDRASMPHANQRLRIDETSYLKVNGEDFSLQDLLHNDVEYLYTMYTHRTSGSVALTRAGIDVDESFDTLLERLNQSSADIGINDEIRKKELDALKFMYDSVRGDFNINEGISDGKRTLMRQIREYNYIRMMGQAGLAATIELAQVVVENGIRRTMRMIPSFGKLVKRAADGKLEDRLQRELFEGTGSGGDVLRAGVTSRMDDPTEANIITAKFTRRDRVLGKLRKATSIAGGLAPITTFLSRLNNRLFAEAMAESLMAGKLPYHPQKLKQLGLNQQKLDLIKGEIEKHAEWNGKELVALNSQNWNPDTKDYFMEALRVDTTQNVQVTNAGSSNPFFRSEWGKMMFQFLNYVVGSNEQQFARQYARIKGGDYTPVKTFMGMMIVASLTYIARVYSNSIGREDRDEYIAKRLEPQNITTGVLSYYGGLGVFTIPMSSMNPEQFLNNPSAQLAGGIYNLHKLADGATEAEVRDALRLAPLQNVIGINQMLNAIAAEAGD